MQSKLSKLQKSILTFLYEGPLSVRELICNLYDEPTHGSENTIYHALDSLEKRELIKGNKVKRYRKTVELTDKGIRNTREILINEGKYVRFCLTKDNLKILLKKLSVEGTFKESVVMIRNTRFISVHRNSHNNTIRYFHAEPDFFSEISGRGLFVFPIKDVKLFLQKFSNVEMIEFEMNGNILNIDTPTIQINNKRCKNPNIIFNSLPYDWQSDLFFYKNMEQMSEIELKISLLDFKQVVVNLNLRDSNYLNISSKGSRVAFLSNDTEILNKKIRFIRGNDFSISMNNGFKHLKNVFDEDIIIKTYRKRISIFSEKTEKYSFGLLIRAFNPDEGMILT